MKKTIYDLKLHETLEISGGMVIMRVPGGWLYDCWDYDKSEYKQGTFVPFSNEFKSKNKEQDYTVIYSDCFMVGGHEHCASKIKTISCKREDLEETIEKDHDIDGLSAVHFVFEGKPKLV